MQRDMTQTLYDELRNLIDDGSNREQECREYLEHTRFFLFKELQVLDIVHWDAEYRLNSGDSDYVISGRVQEEGGVQCVRAYVWELKAPQCSVFRKETNNRLIPSDDLVKAENQLLHYYLEARGDNDFRSTFGVTDEDNVRMGGIIISSENRKVSGVVEERRKEILYGKAMKARKILYAGTGIRLLLWDDILAQLRPPNVGGTRRVYREVLVDTARIPPGTISVIQPAEQSGDH